MNDDQQVVVVAVLTQASRIAAGHWALCGRIVSVEHRVPAERAMVGVQVNLDFRGPMVPHLALKPSVLVRAFIPLVLAEEALDKIADGVPPDQVIVDVEAAAVRPMSEPCPRVPLSLLRELRGFEVGAERSRKVLVKMWEKE